MQKENEESIWRRFFGGRERRTEKKKDENYHGQGKIVSEMWTDGPRRLCKRSASHKETRNCQGQ